MACTEVVCGTGTWTGPVPGDPDNNVSLRAVPAFGGIDVLWTYPATNPHAVAHTLLYRGTTNNRDAALPIAVVAGNSYYDKAEEELRYFYWIRIVSSNGTTGDWVGPASAVVKTRKQGTLEDLTAAIDSGVLATALRQDIDKITLNYSELLTEIQRRVAGDSALSAALLDLQNGVTEAVAFVHQEINTRIDGDTALAQQMGIIAAANADNASAIIDEKTARVTKDEALTTQYNALFAATGNTAAAVVNEASARTNADNALAGQIATVQSTLGSDIASVQTNMQTNINTVAGRVQAIGALYTAKVAVNGLVGGFGVYNDGRTVEAGFDVDRFWIGRTGPDKVKPFIIDGGTVYINKAQIREADIDTLKIAGNAVTVPSLTEGLYEVAFPSSPSWQQTLTSGYEQWPAGTFLTVLATVTCTITSGGDCEMLCVLLNSSGGEAQIFRSVQTMRNGDKLTVVFIGGIAVPHDDSWRVRAYMRNSWSNGTWVSDKTNILVIGAKR